MGHFRVKLHAVKAASLIRHRRDRARIRGRHDLETIGQTRDLITVTHPDFEDAVTFVGPKILNILEQLRMAMRADLGVAELAVIVVTHLAAKLLRHGLHAVANAQHRHPKGEDSRRDFQRRFIVGRSVAARQDDALESLGQLRAQEFLRHVARMKLAVDASFAHAARNQLGNL